MCRSGTTLVNLSLSGMAYFKYVCLGLLPTTAALTARQIYVNRGCKDAGPDVHFVSTGPLQLTVLRHRRRSLNEPTAVCPECGCTFGVGRSTVRPHHANATGAALASGSPIGRFQDGHPGLPTCHCSAWLQPIWPPTASWSPTKVVVSCVLLHQGRVL